MDKKNLTMIFSFLLTSLFICASVSVAAEATYPVVHNGKVLGRITPPIRDNSAFSSLYFPALEFIKLSYKDSKETVTTINGLKTSYITIGEDCYKFVEDNKKSYKYINDRGCTNTETITPVEVKNYFNTIFSEDDNRVYLDPLTLWDIIGGQKLDRVIDKEDKLTYLTSGYEYKKSIIMKINNPWMYVNGDVKKLDPEEGSTPVILEGYTLLPLASIIKEFGGSISWDGSDEKISISLDENNLELWIDKNEAKVNGKQKTLEVAPKIISNRTMVPLRFVSDNLGLQIIWDGANQIVALYYGDYFDLPTDYSRYFIYKTDDQKQSEETNVKNSPIDKNGNEITVGDRIEVGGFYGEVQKINGNRILVYWDSKSVFVPDKDIDFWATIAGVRYKSSSWIAAEEVELEK